MVSSGRDEMMAYDFRLAVTYDDSRKHIERFRAEVSKSCQLCRFTVPANLADNANRRIRPLVPENDAARFGRIISPFLTGRIIEANDKIPSRGAVESFGNGFPRRE